MFDATQFMLRYMREKEQPRLLETAKGLPDFLLKSYRKALEDKEDHRTKLYTSKYEASSFLSIIDSLCAVSDTKVGYLVENGILEDLSVSIMADRIRFGLEIYYAIHCLLRVVQFQNYKYIGSVAKLKIDDGMKITEN